MILDIACGHPDQAGVYRKRGDIGIDLLTGFADSIADSLHLPFRDRSFDHVNLYSCLDHFETPLDALKEARRVSSDGCTVMIRNPAFWQYPFGEHPQDHLYSWLPGDLWHLLKLAGFHPKSIRYANLDTRKTRIRARLFWMLTKIFWNDKRLDQWFFDVYVIEA